MDWSELAPLLAGPATAVARPVIVPTIASAPAIQIKPLDAHHLHRVWIRMGTRSLESSTQQARRGARRYFCATAFKIAVAADG
jgi:hypothetical protein